MRLSKLFWPFKKNRPDSQSVPHATPLELAYIEGFESGFEMGLSMASTLDDIAKKHIYDSALDESLKRLHANNKTPH